MQLPTPLPLLVERPIRVHGYDIDFVGVVSNIVYVRWLEDMRTALLDEHCPLSGFLAEGLSPIIAHTQVDYKRPVRLMDQPTGRMWMTRVGPMKWSLEAQFIVNGAVVAEGRQSGGFVRLSDGHPVRVPESLATAWRKAVASVG
jgi:acyl-CoA thioester hydrolase